MRALIARLVNTRVWVTLSKHGNFHFLDITVFKMSDDYISVWLVYERITVF